MNLYLVRHGKTYMNEKGLIQGTSNTSLSELGIRQAKEAKDNLKDVKFDICISSPLKRTIETATIIVNNKCKIIVDDRLLERLMGEYEGKPHDEYVKGNYWDLKLNNDSKGVEPVKKLFIRAKDFLDYVKSLDYENVLIVSHAAIIRAIHFSIIGYDNNTIFLEFYPKNGKVYKYVI